MKTSTFFKFFPPPKFLNPPHAGIDICDDAVRYIKFSQKKGSLEIETYGTKILPEGVVEAGYVKDEAALTKIIAELVKGANAPFFQASLPEEKLYLFKTEVPHGSEIEM